MPQKQVLPQLVLSVHLNSYTYDITATTATAALAAGAAISAGAVIAAGPASAATFTTDTSTPLF